MEDKSAVAFVFFFPVSVCGVYKLDMQAEERFRTLLDGLGKP